MYRSPVSNIKQAALRVVRTCVGLKYESLNQHLMTQNIFEPTIRVLMDTNGKNNVLNSACLDLLEFLQKENVRDIISHLMAHFGTVLNTLNYAPTFRTLRMRHDENVSVLANVVGEVAEEVEEEVEEEEGTEEEAPRQKRQREDDDGNVNQDETDESPRPKRHRESDKEDDEDGHEAEEVVDVEVDGRVEQAEEEETVEREEAPRIKRLRDDDDDEGDADDEENLHRSKRRASST